GGKRLYACGRLAPADHPRVVDVVGGQVGEGAVTVVLALGAHRAPGARRERQVDAHPGLDAGLLIGTEHVVVLAERPAFPLALVEVKDAPGLDGEARVAREDPRPVLPGLQGVISEPAAHGGWRGGGSDAGGCRLPGQL